MKRKSNKVRGLGMSAITPSFNTIKFESSKPEPPQKVESDIKVSRMVKENNDREVEQVRDKRKSTFTVRTKKPMTLKQIMKEFDNTEDVEVWLKDNSERVLNLKKKEQKKFIDYIKNKYIH